MPETSEVIVVDGREYSGGQFKKGVALAKYSSYTKEDQEVGFTNISLLREWARKEGVLRECNEALEQIKLVRQRLQQKPVTPQEEEQLRKIKRATVYGNTKRLRETLSALNIEAHETDKLLKLGTDYDILVGQILNSAIIYDLRYYRGDWRFLTNGIHPKLSWYKFNDRTESVLVYRSAILFRHTWFRGDIKLVLFARSDLGWFRNRASSAIVF